MKELTEEEKFVLLRVLTLSTLFVHTIYAMSDPEGFEAVLKTNFLAVPKLYPEGAAQPAKDIAAILEWSGLATGDDVAEFLMNQIEVMAEARNEKM